MLRLDQSDLATQAEVSLETIKRLEKLDGELRAQETTLGNIKSALERCGVIFLDDKEGTPRGGPGVRLAENQVEASDDHIHWVQARLLKAADNLKLEGLSREEQRQKRLLAIIGVVDAAEAEFLWQFKDAEAGHFREALGKVLASIMSGSMPKKQRKNYDRTDPENGAGMKGSRPVARSAQIKPTFADDESE
jgi:hypothetical protein